MLSTTDVAALLGITVAGVHKLVQRGRLRTVRKGRGRPTLYLPSSVIAEMDRRGRGL